MTNPDTDTPPSPRPADHARETTAAQRREAQREWCRRAGALIELPFPPVRRP